MSQVPVATPGAAAPARRSSWLRRPRQANSLLAHGEPSIWGMGGALVVALAMIIGLLVLVFLQGATTFWPSPLVHIETVDGKTFLGEVTRTETYRPDPGALASLPAAARASAEDKLRENGGMARRRLLRTGNFELTGTRHHWVSDFQVAQETAPEWAVLIERTEDGIFYGKPTAFLVDGQITATAPATVWADFARCQSDSDDKAKCSMRLTTADGRVQDIPLTRIVRAYPPNQLVWWDKVATYASRWDEFLTDEPRAGSTEGGVLPAIWGTVAITLLLSLAVVPFGVLAALYLREYAKSGPIISAVRIAINNLAGVPSIVFGVFGMGFFCYLVGAYIDGGPTNLQIEPWPEASWWLGLLGAIVLGLISFCVGVLGVRAKIFGPRLSAYLGRGAVVLWLVCLGAVLLLLVRTPYFDGFYRAALDESHTPTFGKKGLLWGALTLALLTLPVVIVATEEALAAVPNSMREGSYACGASKWQTIRRIVLPRALPGIMTGMILAMARGAGEVAPLMLVGADHAARALPVDGTYPYVHGSRSFMHLGYHIFYLGYQSPDSEAARPMVYTTTLLLITIVALLNLMAVWLRARLRRRYLISHF
jgi:ABC-type phosphate transport system permease subunit